MSDSICDKYKKNVCGLAGVESYELWKRTEGVGENGNEHVPTDEEFFHINTVLNKKNFSVRTSLINIS